MIEARLGVLQARMINDSGPADAGTPSHPAVLLEQLPSLSLSTESMIRLIRQGGASSSIVLRSKMVSLARLS